MITAKVLSAVLGFECIPYIDPSDNSFWVLTQYGWNKGEPAYENAKQYPKGLNLHELASLCKEFAFNGIDVKVGAKTYFWLASNKDESGEWHCWTHGSFIKTHFYADTEPEAVFKAMEFILEL